MCQERRQSAHLECSQNICLKTTRGKMKHNNFSHSIISRMEPSNKADHIIESMNAQALKSTKIYLKDKPDTIRKYHNACNHHQNTVRYCKSIAHRNQFLENLKGFHNCCISLFTDTPGSLKNAATCFTQSICFVVSFSINVFERHIIKTVS